MSRFVVPQVQLLAAVVAACGGDGSVSSFVVRDSAGVRIAESRAPAWNDDQVWRIGESIVRIGVVDGDPAYQFSDVAGVVRLTNGTIVVADGGSQQIRFYAPAGHFLRSFGGPGGGPGEFTGLSGLGRTATDAIWAFDFSLRRLTWTDSYGRLARIAPLDPEPPTLSPIGLLPDGTFVFKQLWGSRTAKGEPRTGLQRGPTAYVRFDSLGALVDTLGTFPGRELFVTIEKGRGVMNSPLFGRTSVGAVLGQVLVVGDQATFRLAQHAPDGTLLGEARIPDRISRIGSDEVREYIEFVVESSPPEKQAYLRQSLESMPVPETRPAYGELLVDDGNLLWASEWTQFPAIPQTWTVLDAGGQWLGDVRMPQGFLPREIGSDWILGTESDALGVEYIALYSLVKPAAGEDENVAGV